MSKCFLEIFNTSVSQTLKCYMQLEEQRQSLTEQPFSDSAFKTECAARNELN